MRAGRWIKTCQLSAFLDRICSKLIGVYNSLSICSSCRNVPADWDGPFWLARPTLLARPSMGAGCGILGIIFLPFTTLMYVILWNARVSLSGWDFVWIVMVGFLDITPNTRFITPEQVKSPATRLPDACPRNRLNLTCWVVRAACDQAAFPCWNHRCSTKRVTRLNPTV